MPSSVRRVLCLQGAYSQLGKKLGRGKERQDEEPVAGGRQDESQSASTLPSGEEGHTDQENWLAELLICPGHA